MSYLAHPAGSFNWVTESPQKPRSVVNAVRLMYVGAAFEVLGLIISIARIGTVTSLLMAYDSVTFGVAHDAAVRVVKWYAVFAVISVGLWLWMASRNAAGHNWARTVATVLFAVFTLETASTVMLNLHMRGSTPGITVLDVVGWLVALAATICLWRRDASQYFEQCHYR
jgi:hypothetical protein